MPEEVFYKLALKLPWSQKWMFWRLKIDFFAHFSVNKLKMFLGKARQNIQNCVNPKSDIENILENCFETTLRSRVNVLLNLEGNFQFFVHFWAMKLKPLTVKAKPSVQKSLNPKLIMVHGKHFRKCFQSNPVKPECSELLKRAFFSFLQIFEWRSWNQFLGKWSKEFKTI